MPHTFPRTFPHAAALAAPAPPETFRDALLTCVIGLVIRAWIRLSLPNVEIDD